MPTRTLNIYWKHVGGRLELCARAHRSDRNMSQRIFSSELKKFRAEHSAPPPGSTTVNYFPLAKASPTFSIQSRSAEKHQLGKPAPSSGTAFGRAFSAQYDRHPQFLSRYARRPRRRSGRHRSVGGSRRAGIEIVRGGLLRQQSRCKAACAPAFLRPWVGTVTFAAHRRRAS